jgi:hypothetical protein
MVATVNISVIEGREYLVTAPAGVTVRYNGEIVTSTFIAVSSVNQVILVTQSALSGQITITEILRSYYDAYDAQGAVWAYQPALDKWVSQYSFRPDWMSMVGNRLVTFKSGYPYVHDGALNTFYGQTYDSVLAFAHSDAGNVTKVYQAAAFEGDTPDLLHIRTEVPNVQSSDLRAADFVSKEGVKYGSILRDRLSPNVTGTADEKLYKGDNMRGEIGLFQGVFFGPTAKKIWNFVNISFVPSRGHETQQ